MSGPISTDVHFQAWMTAPEDRRQAAHAVLIGSGQDRAAQGRALTITEAARRAGTCRGLVYRAIAAGALRSFRPFAGANPRVLESELARWMGGRKGAAG